MKITRILTPLEVELRTNPAFRFVLNETIKAEGFLANFSRLYGCNVPLPKTPIDAMIDEATGARDAQMHSFLITLLPFVWERVYLPMQDHFSRSAR